MEPHELVQALAVLRWARGKYDHSPNGETMKTVCAAEDNLNSLLDAMLTVERAPIDAALP